MMESSIGGVVPAVKGEVMRRMAEKEDGSSVRDEEAGTTAEWEMDRELLCPICMQIIKDAFLTACGHSFCYMCIVTHLHNKSDCPCCSHYLTTSQLYPNFLLDKMWTTSSSSWRFR